MVMSVGRIVIAAAAIGAAVLVGNAAVSVYHTAALRNESAAVLHSNELLLALDNVLSLVKDAESGQRGYVITGRLEYLAPYRAAVASIQAQMDALEQLAREDPVQLRLMADVRRRVGAKLGELEVTPGDRDGRRLNPVPRPHRAPDGRSDRADERDVRPPGRADARGDAGGREAGCGGDGHQTSTPESRSPDVAGRPKSSLTFWIAWPAAPFPRLSSAQITIVRSV